MINKPEIKAIFVIFAFALFGWWVVYLGCSPAVGFLVLFVGIFYTSNVSFPFIEMVYHKFFSTTEDDEDGEVFIKKGQLRKAIRNLKAFVKPADKYLKIQDSYFSEELLDIIEELSPMLDVELLTGHLAGNRRNNIEEAKSNLEKQIGYMRKSGRRIAVTVFTHKVPFHDRFYITDNGCVQVGTSASGLGLKDTTLHKKKNWKDIEAQFDVYFDISSELEENLPRIRI